MTAQKEKHTIMSGLTDHGYCRFYTRRKVTCLLDGIKTELIDALRENITQDSKLHRYFDRCVTFYKEFIKLSSGNQSNEVRRVAEVGLHKKGHGDVEDRYYSK